MQVLSQSVNTFNLVELKSSEIAEALYENNNINNNIAFFTKQVGVG